MPLLEILRLGRPLLLERARPVGEPRAPALRALAADMVETMRASGGIGLAAPQVGYGIRLIVALPIAAREDSRAIDPLVLADPELEPSGQEVEEAYEGCLSIPELRGIVPRARRVVWRARDLEGRPLEGEAEGLLARILQHEVDHLDGILFPMRMRDLRTLAFESELRRAAAAAARESELGRAAAAEAVAARSGAAGSGPDGFGFDRRAGGGR